MHFKRVSYLVAPNTQTRPVGGKRIRIFEREDGTVELRHGEQVLPYSIFDKNPHINEGAIVENKRLDAVSSVVQAEQTRRDEQRLASTKLTLRQKKRIRASLAAISIPNPAAVPRDAASEYLRRVVEEQKRRKRIENLKYRRQRYEQEQAASPAPPARAKG